MGLKNVYYQIITTQFEELFTELEAQDKCQDCEGHGFHTKSNYNEFILLDNSYKCLRCNGRGFICNY